MNHERYMFLGPAKHGRRHNSWVWPSVGLLATSALGITLTVMNARNWRSSESTAAYVQDNRSVIAVAVQILSSVLGFLQVHALCYTISSSFRVSQLLRAYSLDMMRFVDAVSTPTLAWDVRWHFGLASAIFVAFSIAPAALWSGALTPIVAERNATRLINIPTFESNNYTEMWNPGNNTAAQRIDGYGESPVWITDNGLFTFDLSLSSVSGTFQGLASSSSNASYTGGYRTKFDSSGYRFAGRSYGVGASAGLIKIPDTGSPSWYTYYEVGLKTKATCAKNESATYSIGYIFSSDKDYRHEFQSNGTFANGAKVPDHYPLIAPQRQDIFVWSVGHFGPDDMAVNKTLLSLGSDTTTEEDVWDFHQLNHVQCEVTFEATNFSVVVNVTSETVEVEETSRVPVPEWANFVLWRLDDPYSRYSGNDRIVFGSQLGHSIILNINQLRILKGNETDDGEDIMFQGIQDYVESLVDNGVGMLSATRLIGADHTVEVTTVVGLPAVAYGKPVFVYLLLGINCVVLLIFSAEAIRTSFWKGMADLHLSDVGAVILAASQGGYALAARSSERRKGDVGDISVQLVKVGDGSKEAIVLPEMVNDSIEGAGNSASGYSVELHRKRMEIARL